MKFPKTIKITPALLIFLFTLLLVISNTFYIPKNSINHGIMDRVFFVLVHITFWLSTAFLLNAIINKFFWGGIKKVPLGDYFFHKLKDFISSSLYVIALVVIAITVFYIDLTFNLLSIAVIITLLGTFLRPTLLSFFNSMFLSNSNYFNLGDRVNLRSNNGNLEVIGEVEDVDRKTLTVKTENNNLIVISQSNLENYVVKNYSTLHNESRFEIELILDYSVSTRRVKRILIAGTKQAIMENEFCSEPEPEVIVKELSDYGIKYVIYFWLVPWEKHSPTKAKDLVLSTILEHLTKSGVNIAYPKSDLFISRYYQKQTDLSLTADVKKILAKVELFNTLNENELELLANNISEEEYKEGDVLINQGDDGESMFVLVEGLLNAFIDTNNNQQIRVGRLTPGEFFGEMSLLTGDKRSATIISATDAIVFKIDKKDISPIIENRESVINEFGEIISERHKINLQLKEEHEKQKENKLEQLIHRITNFFKK